MTVDRVLVTGVTGFIGGRLARLLARQGREVHAVVRFGSASVSDLPVVPHVHDGTVASLHRIVAAVRPRTVFHLASLYVTEHMSEQVAPLVESNVAFPALLAEAMVANGVNRLVNTGTSWQHLHGHLREPVNLYAATKQAFAEILTFYCSARAMQAVTLKLFDTYGVGDQRRKLVQLLVDIARSGEPLGMSPGEQIVDLTHVDDVCEAFVAAEGVLDQMSAAGHREFLVSGERHTVRELAALVATVLDRPVDARFGERPYRAREVMIPIKPTDSDLLPGWSPQRHLATELTALE